MFDLMIIGGGPAGYVAAERAGSKGLKVVLFEKKKIGGVCLNEGCIPTKALLYSAKMYEHAVEGEKFGVYGDNIRFDYGQMVSRKNKLVRKLVGGVNMKMKANKVEVVEGEAVIESRSDKGVEISCNGEKYTGKNVLISTGSEASVPPIPGLKEAGDVIVTNREILEMKERPESLVVIGGGVIGMEFACFYHGLGTTVTVVEMLPEILGEIDREISTMVRKLFDKKGIKFHMSAKVTKVDGNKVTFEKDGKTETVEGEKILLSVGRRPVTKGFGLENINVELDRGGIKVDEKMRTNVPNVFAAGDVTGFSLLAHTASREGEVVVNNLTGRNDIMRYNAIPGVVYINPEVAGVGETEESAKKKGIAYKVAKLPMTYAGRFSIENEGFNGLCKILIGEKYGEVIGVHMLGNPSSEMIYGACMAIEQEMTLEEMKEVVFPHPTVSEIFKEVVFSEFK
ncbi:MAG: dihydrolipoyl dehydrogenase [Dysgonamonadaceae bacterium]|jgi:dihydrolipoamide dehydrogenase|nr:dihydrolipoyl dehydrogenase [Dysgonamonadaceae bacterium]MDD3356773.1 dihydrolipoyl dehydrogenase [Dysgonamonadaceae bacterium]MDD3727969.1 dihydrolipoyl dehydrogenase [Dysgonamonadaceae bacterium]MDD4246483.1 dihydrolipoyl dehydrogenase [Dysgonamonadaceae bacterium]MDD4606184.1 dihydrolipoyl dehydrogenase [Dysgonamonadaceae bacterium]